jgi:two-component sensor histidine kinase
MNTRHDLRAWPVEPIGGVHLPIEISESERGEMSHRLNNRLQVILSAAQLIACDTQEDKTRPRARAIQTAARGIIEDINELFGPVQAGVPGSS